MKGETPGYYAIIPANVRYSNLKPHAKLLYGEITALAHKEGYCFATNRYFAKLYDVTKNTVSSWISDLHKHGFVTVQIIKEGNQVVERRIGIIKKDDTPITKNLVDNNTSDINTINKLSIRLNEFKNEIAELNFDKNIKSQFFLYWSEFNRSKTKMRWELERTWNTVSRIQRFQNNQKKWNPKNSKSLKNKLDTFNKAKQMMNQINNR